MKQYKVGDTIYVKGKITDVDHNETMLPYCVVSSPNYHFWASQESVIDELPTSEPVKPVLPKNVADEIQQAKDMRLNFYMYIIKFSNDSATCDFAFHNCLADVSDEQFKILSDAWFNGYTVEKPKLYNLILGTREDSPLQAAFVKINDWDDNTYLSLNAGSIPHDLTISQYQFTQEEIDKYNKNFWIKNFDLNDYKVEVSADEN